MQLGPVSVTDDDIDLDFVKTLNEADDEQKIENGNRRGMRRGMYDHLAKSMESKAPRALEVLKDLDFEIKEL